MRELRGFAEGLRGSDEGIRGRNRMVVSFPQGGKSPYDFGGAGLGADHKRREEHEQKLLAPRAAILGF